MWSSLSVVLLVAMAVEAYNSSSQLQTDGIIMTVNSANTTWKAARNFHPSLKNTYMKHLLGLKMRPHWAQSLPELVGEASNDEIPEKFDARDKWKACTSLHDIPDQGACGSCWAVSTAATFTDRFCISSNGSFNGHLSALQLISCACNGCKGGSIPEAWKYFRNQGLVTGGFHNSLEGCQPYTFASCDHRISGPNPDCPPDYLPTPPCMKTCYNKAYTTKTYKEDLHKAKSLFCISNNNQRIQTEIFKNGPITAGFSVYEDFFAYKSGVYQRTTGVHVGSHAVKVIGWGVEGGTPYWLAANSWNSFWGDNGFFKIRRGNNECSFEEDMCGGQAVV